MKSKSFILFKYLILIGLLVLLAPNVYAQTETISLTTYYPAPFGVYQEIRLEPDTGNAMRCEPGFGNDGNMRIDTNNILQVCDKTIDAWVPISGLWENNAGAGPVTLIDSLPVDVDNTLDVTGATTLDATLDVVGLATLSAAATVGTDLSVDGNTILGDAPGDTVGVGGDITVTGITTLNGDVDLGSDAADTVSMLGVVDTPVEINPNPATADALNINNGAADVNMDIGNTTTANFGRLSWTNANSNFAIETNGGAGIGLQGDGVTIANTSANAVDPTATLEVFGNGGSGTDVFAATGTDGVQVLRVGDGPAGATTSVVIGPPVMNNIPGTAAEAAQIMLWIGNRGPDDDIPGVLIDDDLETTETIFAAAHVYESSDEKLKQNIRPIENALEIIEQLEGVEYEWKKDGTSGVGLIAQNVEEVYPFLVKTSTITHAKYLTYTGLFGPVIQAIKEQQVIIEEQHAMIEELQEEVHNLQKQERKKSIFGFLSF